MTLVSALRCDAMFVPPPTPNPLPYAALATAYTRDRIECSVVSRDARNPNVLGLVTTRDGWITRADGSHLCPEHAAAEKGAAA